MNSMNVKIDVSLLLLTYFLILYGGIIAGVRKKGLCIFGATKAVKFNQRIERNYSFSPLRNIK